VEGLDDRDILLFTCFVDGRRHHRKSVVNMNNIWLEIAKQAADSKLAIAGRNDSSDQTQPLPEGQIIKLVITTLIATNPVPISLQQSGLLSNYNILSTWLLVTVMDDENIHGDRG